MKGYSDEGSCQPLIIDIRQMLPPAFTKSLHKKAFSRMSPQRRMQFGQHLQQRASKGYNFPELRQDGQDDHFQDPSYLAQGNWSRASTSSSQISWSVNKAVPQEAYGWSRKAVTFWVILAKAAMAGITAASSQKKMMGRKADRQGAVR